MSEFEAAAIEAAIKGAARDFHLSRDITVAPNEFTRELHKTIVGENIYFEENKCYYVTDGRLESKELGVDSQNREYRDVNEMPQEKFEEFLRTLPQDTQIKMTEYRKNNPITIVEAPEQLKAREASRTANQGAMADYYADVTKPKPEGMSVAEEKTYWETFTDALNYIMNGIIKGIKKLWEFIEKNQKSVEFVAKCFLLKYLTETTLNSMLAGSNGCWVVDAVTGNQVFQINTDKDANKCKCEVDSGTTHIGSIYQACEIQCRNVSGSAQNYGGCLGTSCNCKDTTGVITPQNYTVKVVNDNCYTMFAKVLSATGLMVSDFVGGVADGFYNITDAFKSVFSKWWILAIVGGIILVIVVIVYLVMYFKSKKNNARQQGGPNITVVSSAPPPSAPPPSFDDFANRPRA